MKKVIGIVFIFAFSMLLFSCPEILDFMTTTTTTTTVVATTTTTSTITPATTTTTSTTITPPTTTTTSTTTTTTIPTYTFAYDGNSNTSGTIPAEPVQYTTGSEILVLDNNGNLAKAGFSYFIGWNTQPDGNGINEVVDSYIYMGSENLTLYAQYGNIPPLGAVGPAGGNVFYDKGSYSDGWRYLEAGPKATEEIKAWWSGSSTTVGAIGTAIGTGKANTNAIVATSGSNGSAAKYCADLVYGGYDDWYLPSIDELELIYNNLKKKYKGNYTNYYYWSSTEFSMYDANTYYFNGSSLNIGESNKANGANASDRINVRPVRAF